MKKYSKSQLAKAYLALAQERSPGEAISALAAAVITQKMTHQVDLVVREISRHLQNQGIILGEVVSARELSQELKSQITHLLKRVSGGSEVHLNYRQDEAVIGGFRAQLPTQEVDASVASLLRRLSPVSSH